MRHERNYYRQEIIPLIASRNMLYLKHYAHRSNELAQELDLYAGGKSKDYSIHYSSQNDLPFHSRGGHRASEDLKSIISRMVHFKRATYIDQINKLSELMLQENPKRGARILRQLNVYLYKNQVFL